jgi:hypothetical protein
LGECKACDKDNNVNKAAVKRVKQLSDMMVVDVIRLESSVQRETLVWIDTSVACRSCCLSRLVMGRLLLFVCLWDDGYVESSTGAYCPCGTSVKEVIFCNPPRGQVARDMSNACYCYCHSRQTSLCCKLQGYRLDGKMNCTVVSFMGCCQ